MGHLREKYTIDFHSRTGKEKNEKAISFMKSLIGDLKNKDALEIGFGRGEIIPLLLQEGIRSYHGIDFSKHAFKIASERIQDPKVQFECVDAKDLNEARMYDVVLMNDVIEHIPVFEMEIVWEKIRDLLCPGGYIVIRTPLYEKPNMANEYDNHHDTMGMLCHKQTFGTILRTCLEHEFVLAKMEQTCFGLVRAEDLKLFSSEQRSIFLNCHQQILAENGLEMKDTYEKEELRKLVPGPGRLLIGCVTENFSPYRDQALNLVKSIRWFSGNLADVNIFICVVDKVDQTYVDELEKWGVFVRVVKRFSKTHPPSNKLRLFELEEIRSYDTVMLLDCDTIVVQNPYPYIDGHYFQAEIAASPSVTDEMFKNLFTHYKLPLPPQKYKTALKKIPTIWYCNAGVLIFPTNILKEFYPVWKYYTLDLDRKKRLLGKKHFFCEQASLTIANTIQPIPFKKLPMKMNFHNTPTLIPHVKACDPVIIHYHKGMNESGLINNVSPSPSARNRIQKFNNRLQNSLREKTRYENRMQRKFQLKQKRINNRLRKGQNQS